MTRPAIILLLSAISIAGFIPTDSASAQWNYRVNLNGAYDSNPLGLNGASPGAFLSVSGGASYWSRSVGAGYNGAITGYDQPTELSSYVHRGYLNFGDETTGLYASAEQRIGTQSSLYDYTSLRSTIGHDFGCLGFSCTISATGSTHRFSELTDRNQWKLVPQLRLSRSFQTKTTLIASTGAGYTYYTDLVTDEAQTQDSDIAQLTFNLRIAQSVTPTTGAAAFYQHRSIHGATSMTFIDEENGISYALLDDPSLYGNQVVGGELTQMLKEYTISLKVGGSYSYRNYPTQGIYLDSGEYDTEVLREDRYATVWMVASWSIPWDGRTLSLDLAGQWSDNQSNSYWYDYAGSYLSIGLGIGL